MAASQIAASQRIAFLANAVVTAESSFERRPLQLQLRQTTRTMRQTHAFLTLKANPTRRDRLQLEAVQEIYFDDQLPFDQQVTDFLDRAEVLATTPSMELTADHPDLIRVNLAGSTFLMQTHEMIVEILQKNADDAIGLVERIQLAVWILTMGTILGTALLVFAPTGRRIEEGVLRIEDAETKAKQAAAHALNASRSKSNFLRIVSHEIRTPLNAITGTISLLKEDDLPEHAKENYRMLSSASKALNELTGNVLDFERLENGNFRIRNDPFNVGDELKICEDLIRSACEEKGLDFKTETSVDDLIVVGDNARMRQVLLNLLSNAVKFTETGSVTLSCNVTEESDDRVKLEFGVTDTGCGIDQSTQKNIFRYFDHLDGFENKRQAGAGIGLAVAAGMAKRMNGILTFASTPGKGSTFRLAASFKRGTMTKSQNTAPNANGRILIVEDNLTNQMIAKAYLQKAGYSLDIANNGQEGLDKAQNTKFDLILMDINMPVMDGLEATRRLRQVERYNSTPILALTAHALEEDQSDILSAGLNEILKKPITQGVLVDAVQNWMTQSLPLQQSA
ncbi:MAG: response regulator [Pseudomonadota bacterium]